MTILPVQKNQVLKCRLRDDYKVVFSSVFLNPSSNIKFLWGKNCRIFAAGLMPKHMVKLGNIGGIPTGKPKDFFEWLSLELKREGQFPSR